MPKPQPKRRNPRYQDLLGRDFGLLHVVQWLCRTHPANHWWKCVCQCGGETIACTHDLRTGHKKSCGCLKRPHGQSYSPTYSSWAAAMSRCHKRSDISFPNYGGRGIKVCERFKNFSSFLAGVGERPSKQHTIDRIDANGNYSCGECDQCLANGWVANCRWATKSEQANNRRSTVFLTFNGATKSATEWAFAYGLGRSLVSTRIRKGWSVEAAITTPPKNSRFESGSVKPGQYVPQVHTETLNGETLPLAEWAKRCGISYGGMLLRLKLDWPLEKILTKPSRGYGRKKATAYSNQARVAS